MARFRFALLVALGLVLMISSLAVSQDLDAQRLDMIHQLQQRGIFGDIKIPGDVPHLYVKPAFHTLDFDKKNAFVGVVFAYYFADDPDHGMVIVYDNQTDKKIGTFCKQDGGLKLD